MARSSEEGVLMRTVPGILAALAVLGVAGNQAQRLKPIVNPTVNVAGTAANDTHASASLLGQFRTSAATWLYLHADLYLHNGVEMRPLTDGERRQGDRGSKAATNDLGANEGSGETTVIPGAKNDFRGWIGDLERAGGAYKDMKNHRHNPPEVAIPLFRLMTLVDPTFIPGWTMGAMIINGDQKTGPDKAIAFLSRGVKENPAEFRLRYQLGFYLAAYRHSMKDALPWFEQARSMSLGRHDLSDDEAESLQNTYRWLGLCYRDLNQHANQLAVVEEGLQRFPKDMVLVRLAKAQR